jgi:hypothetical protein
VREVNWGLVIARRRSLCQISGFDCIANGKFMGGMFKPRALNMPEISGY